MTKREELYLKGMEMIKKFAELNNIDISDIDFFVRYNKKDCPKGFNRYINYSGLCIYKTKRKNRYSIFVNLPKSVNTRAPAPSPSERVVTNSDLIELIAFVFSSEVIESRSRPLSINTRSTKKPTCRASTR